MRPRTLDEFFGQNDVVGEGKILRRMLEHGSLESSLIFWGPPGCWQDDARAYHSREGRREFRLLLRGHRDTADVRRIVGEAAQRLGYNSRRTILVDEIHRFNKAQQDAFDNGTIILIGATTENPSFEVILPLLSRCRVLSQVARRGRDCGDPPSRDRGQGARIREEKDRGRPEGPRLPRPSRQRRREDRAQCSLRCRLRPSPARGP